MQKYKYYRIFTNKSIYNYPNITLFLWLKAYLAIDLLQNLVFTGKTIWKYSYLCLSISILLHISIIVFVYYCIPIIEIECLKLTYKSIDLKA